MLTELYCADSLAHTQGFSQGSQGYSNQRQAGRDDGVRGAPIEGEDVKVGLLRTQDSHVPYACLILQQSGGLLLKIGFWEQ